MRGTRQKKKKPESVTYALKLCNFIVQMRRFSAIRGLVYLLRSYTTKTTTCLKQAYNNEEYLLTLSAADTSSSRRCRGGRTRRARRRTCFRGPGCSGSSGASQTRDTSPSGRPLGRPRTAWNNKKDGTSELNQEGWGHTNPDPNKWRNHEAILRQRV